MPKKKPVVLIVDDSCDDVALFQLAARGIGSKIEWRYLNSGVDALAYLSGEGTYAKRDNHPIPHLLILDLKMPDISGFDVLSRLKRLNPAQRPFICVMSTSELKVDSNRALSLGADVVYTKPFEFDGLCQLLEELTNLVCLSPQQQARI